MSDRYLPSHIVSTQDPEAAWTAARLLEEHQTACDILNELIVLFDFVGMPLIVHIGGHRGVLDVLEYVKSSGVHDIVRISFKHQECDIDLSENDERVEEIAQLIFKNSYAVTIETYAAAYVEQRELSLQAYFCIVNELRERFIAGEIVTQQWRRFFEWERNRAQLKVEQLNLLIVEMREYAFNRQVFHEIEEEMQKTRAWLDLHNVKYSKGASEYGSYIWRIDDAESI